MIRFSQKLMMSTVLVSSFLLTAEFSFAADTALDTVKIIKEIADTMNKSDQKAVCKAYGPLRKGGGKRCENNDIGIIARVLCADPNLDKKDLKDFLDSDCNNKISDNIITGEVDFKNNFNLKPDNPIRSFVCQVNDKQKFKGTARNLVFSDYEKNCQNQLPADKSSTPSVGQKVSATASAAKQKIKDLISKTSKYVKDLKTDLLNPDGMTREQKGQVDKLWPTVKDKIEKNPQLYEIDDFNKALEIMEKYTNTKMSKMTPAQGDELIAAYKTILKL